MEQPNEDCASPATSSQSKKPAQVLYVPKQRLQAKDKAQPQGEVKPRPRPRYTDKARKNAKNKKDKVGSGQKTAPDGAEVQNDDTRPDGKEERLQGTEKEINGQANSANVETEVTSRLEAVSSEEDEKGEESWDTLFNDDGDCLRQQLLEEVRT